MANNKSKGADMNELTDLICTLVNKSAGGGVSLETLVPQDIAGVAVILKNGQVALLGGGGE